MALARAVGVSDAYVRRLEELSMNAWPSLETILHDGWVLRFASGYTRRANSVHPLYPSLDEEEEKVRLCQRLYRDRGLPAVFKLTPAASEVDGLLSRLGYATEGESLVLMTDLADLPAPARIDVEVLPQATNGWIGEFCMLERSARRHFATITQMTSRIMPPAAFVVLRENGETVGMGMGVVEQDYCGVFNLVTRQTKRGQGIGRDVTLHLLSWGQRQGAKHAYLQVEQANEPALHLYRALGFEPVYGYHYRVRPSSR